LGIQVFKEEMDLWEKMELQVLKDQLDQRDQLEILEILD
jgi:hypothetical protein